LAIDKGLDHILRLGGKLKDDFSFLVAGRGPMQTTVEALCKRDRRFKYLGGIPSGDVPIFLNCGDYAVNPTPNPGHLRVNMEALACGVPVIAASNIDRYPVVHGQTGFLYSGDEGLLKLVSEACQEKLTLRDFGNSRRKACRFFDLDSVSNRILSVYKSVI
jgi:glycosyltransferase involved in cell wall biosynthesis